MSNKFTGLARSSAICALVLLTIPLLSQAATRIVPDFSPTIQAAIDSSATGDTVLVHAGTYVENLHTDGKKLTLKALGTPENTIIDGDQQGSVIWVTADVHIEGFTIRNGLGEEGGGIRAEGPAGSANSITVVIIENAITGNRAGFFVDQGSGGGVLLHNARDSAIERNTFTLNYAGDSGGGIYDDLAFFNVLRDNVFVENGCHVGGGAIGGAMYEVTGNLILRNWSDSVGGGISGVFGTIRNNTIVSNYINNPLFPQGAGIHVGGGSPTIEQNIVALNHGPSGRNTGVGIKCGTFDGPIDIRCNDVWGNDIDIQLFAGCDTSGLGNFSEDPQFCGPGGDNFTLDALSPCAEDNSQGCGLVGAYSVGCMVPIVKATWGRIKTLYILDN